MRVNPSAHLPLFQATYIVGCDSENAKKVWIEADKALPELGEYEYIAFFDELGDKIGEVRVDIEPSAKHEGVWFETEY